jgi:gas vesicle protein
MSDRKSNTVRKIAIGSAIAGAAGYIAGILSAPRSGRQTRQEIANKAEDVKGSTEDQLQELSDELKDMIRTTKDKTTSLSSTARAELNEAVVRAKDAQNKAGQVLKAVRAGEASDPDLNRAIKQAKQAAKNLGKYMKS